jgi:hypothetical protein
VPALLLGYRTPATSTDHPPTNLRASPLAPAPVSQVAHRIFRLPEGFRTRYLRARRRRVRTSGHLVPCRRLVRTRCGLVEVVLLTNMQVRALFGLQVVVELELIPRDSDLRRFDCLGA